MEVDEDAGELSQRKENKFKRESGAEEKAKELLKRSIKNRSSLCHQAALRPLIFAGVFTSSFVVSYSDELGTRSLACGTNVFRFRLPVIVIARDDGCGESDLLGTVGESDLLTGAGSSLLPLLPLDS